MTRQSWAFRPYDPSDLEPVRTLYRLVKRRNRPLDYDRWRLGDNPFSRSISLVVMEGEACIGVFAVWPTQMRIGAETVLGGQAIDAITHPDHRGRGIFRDLVEASHRLAGEAGATLLYAFPNLKSYPIFTGPLAWVHVGDVPLLSRSLLPLATRLRRRGEWPALWRSLMKRSRSGSEVRIGPAGAFPDGFDPLLEQWREVQGLCRVERSRAWYHWRYAAPDGKEREWVGCYRGGRLAACALWGVDTSGGESRGILYDLVGTDPAALGEATAGCVARAVGKQCKSVLLFTNDPIALTVARDAGFLVTDRRPLIVRRLTTRTLGSDVHDSGAWRVSTGDFDAL